VEPNYTPPEDDEDWTRLHKGAGIVIYKNKPALKPRDDIITYNAEQHETQFNTNIQWQTTPAKARPRIEALIKRFWDVFDEEGVSRPIPGYAFHINTGAIKPFSCKMLRYGAHEARVITELVEALEKKNWIEDDFGPWGSIIVLAAKPNQAHVAWWEFVFRLCVAYRKLNRFTRLFRFPTPRCDEAVRGIRGNYFITMDLDCGYWQVQLDKASRDKTAFYTPEGKKHWMVMPMGATNAQPFFIAMVGDMRKAWNALAERQEIKLCSTTVPKLGKDDPDSKTILDDVILYAYTPDVLIGYFTVELEVLQHYHVTVKLRKSRFVQQAVKFVGMDILAEGNSPAKSKDKAFHKMTYPKSFTGLRGFIGFIGFYQDFIPLYEV
jgi:hypothetical protein